MNVPTGSLSFCASVGHSTLGGLGGFAAGGKAGAAIGGTIGAFFGGIGAAPGAAIGGAIGALLGGFGGSALGGAAADKVTGVKQYQEGGGVVPGRKPVTRTIEKIKKKPKKFFLKKPVKRPPLKAPEGKDESEKKVITKITDIDNAFSETPSWTIRLKTSRWVLCANLLSIVVQQPELSPAGTQEGRSNEFLKKTN